MATVCCALCLEVFRWEQGASWLGAVECLLVTFHCFKGLQNDFLESLGRLALENTLHQPCAARNCTHSTRTYSALGFQPPSCRSLFPTRRAPSFPATSPSRTHLRCALVCSLTSLAGADGWRGPGVLLVHPIPAHIQLAEPCQLCCLPRCV